MSLKRRNGGFTLVELLVVIGIIALLISILLPALARAKATANAIVCESNLHNIGLLFTEYEAENNGYIPFADGAVFGGPDTANANAGSWALEGASWEGNSLITESEWNGSFSWYELLSVMSGIPDTGPYTGCAQNSLVPFTKGVAYGPPQPQYGQPLACYTNRPYHPADVLGIFHDVDVPPLPWMSYGVDGNLDGATWSANSTGYMLNNGVTASGTGPNWDGRDHHNAQANGGWYNGQDILSFTGTVDYGWGGYNNGGNTKILPSTFAHFKNPASVFFVWCNSVNVEPMGGGIYKLGTEDTRSEYIDAGAYGSQDPNAATTNCLNYPTPILDNGFANSIGQPNGTTVNTAYLNNNGYTNLISLGVDNNSGEPCSAVPGSVNLAVLRYENVDITNHGWSGGYAWNGFNQMRFRHMFNTQLNVLFLDGHVETRKIGQVVGKDICLNRVTA